MNHLKHRLNPQKKKSLYQSSVFISFPTIPASSRAAVLKPGKHKKNEQRTTAGRRIREEEVRLTKKNQTNNDPQVDRGPCLSPCRSPSSFREQRPTSAPGDSSPRWLRGPAPVRSRSFHCATTQRTKLSHFHVTQFCRCCVMIRFCCYRVTSL